jgi:hypothetical protein
MNPALQEGEAEPYLARCELVNSRGLSTSCTAGPMPRSRLGPMLHLPSRTEVRKAAGALMFFCGAGLITLLTTTPPPSKYYPSWAFWLAGSGVVIGFLMFVGTLVWPKVEPDWVTRRAMHKALTGKKLSRRERRRLEGREPQLFAPSVIQGDRPGWNASCSDAGYTGSDNRHGAHLFLSSDRETAKTFRCLVREPGGQAILAYPSGGQVGQMMLHYPADFAGAPALTVGEYTFEWFGYVTGEKHEMLLARASFRLNNGLQVFCAPRPFEGELLTFPLWKFGGATLLGLVRQLDAARISIGLGNPGVLALVLKCSVEDPRKLQTTVVPKPASATTMLLTTQTPGVVSVVYPDDFAEALPISDGTYSVTWLPQVQAPMPPLVFEFTVQDGRVVKAK